MNVVDRLQKNLITTDSVLFGYLFGSYAKGLQTERSDIDIALYLNDTDLDTQLQITYELSKLLGKEIDLLVLNRAKNLYLLDEVFQEGIIIKESPKRFDFELIKQHQILDYKAFKKRLYVA
ncbi:MAG TPA: nucleotidyltransferase domain-containing protein [Campylobacterales bacterium]|nr:nucleotidyltransferase domain-containing protein [Campylobacterales bacterium]